LPQQIPALVELNLHRAKPPVLLGFIDLAVLQLRSQLLLFGYELIDVIENVSVLVHQPSVPDYG
jgi:hypothetical protein